MRKDILTPEQKSLVPLLKNFSGTFYLAGGTAIALQIGHRRSIDFDLFTRDSIHRTRIRNIVREMGFEIQDLLFEAYDQMHFLIHDVKITFFSYPFEIPVSVDFEDVIRMPSLLDLAAMKAYALGGRGKWKDYVDLYFLLKEHVTLQEIEGRADVLFGPVFNAKLFKEQLSYFEDIDFTEAIDFAGQSIPDEEIKAFLTQTAITRFS